MHYINLNLNKFPSLSQYDIYSEKISKLHTFKFVSLFLHSSIPISGYDGGVRVEFEDPEGGFFIRDTADLQDSRLIQGWELIN